MEGTRQDHELASTQQVWDATGTYVTVAKVQLEVVGNSAPAKTFDRERIVIGSHEAADFVVPDPTVSRMHCELVPASDRVILRDLHSKNGTRIHGVSFKEATLTGTTILQLGHSKLRMVVENSSANLPLFEGERLGRLVGQSPAMRRVFAIVEAAAKPDKADRAVLIQGEPGTGKSAVAATIHQLGARGEQPMQVVDCSALPRELLDIELFGHERGAFAGATTSRPGAFERADGSSLLLTEIGELPLELQSKVLHVLERRAVRRIGGLQTIPVNVRLMAATDRSLALEVNSHRFRAELYYRLAELRVVLPPLRTRLEDLPLLVGDLATQLATTEDERRWLTSEGVIAELNAHHWSGNVGELRNYLEACVALKMPAVIHSACSEPPPEPVPPPAIDPTRPLAEARSEWLNSFERAYTVALLRQHRGDVAAAAQAAGTDRLTFCRMLRRLGIR